MEEVMQIIEKDGFKFSPKKIRDGLWEVHLIRHGDYAIRASEGKTKKEAIANFHKLSSKFDVKEAVQTFVHKKVRKRFWESEKIQSLFKHYFKINLNSFQCILMPNSLDVIRFDTWLKTPNGMSTKDYLTQVYGEQASRLVRKLIK